MGSEPSGRTGCPRQEGHRPGHSAVLVLRGAVRVLAVWVESRGAGVSGVVAHGVARSSGPAGVPVWGDEAVTAASEFKAAP
jgi:hypothetical protein